MLFYNLSSLTWNLLVEPVWVICIKVVLEMTFSFQISLTPGVYITKSCLFFVHKWPIRILVNLLKADLHVWIVFINIVFQLQIIVRGVGTGEWAGHKDWIKYSVPKKPSIRFLLNYWLLWAVAPPCWKKMYFFLATLTFSKNAARTCPSHLSEYCIWKWADSDCSC
jgi:hypothetical protein